jgi:hypothetical protein
VENTSEQGKILLGKKKLIYCNETPCLSFEWKDWDAGRGLVESKSVKNAEQILLQMIADDTLDDYNRVVAYRTLDYLQKNRKADKQKPTQVDEQLENTRKNLPAYLQ